MMVTLTVLRVSMHVTASLCPATRKSEIDAPAVPGGGQADGLRDAAGEHGTRHGEGTDGKRKPRRAATHVGDLPDARDAQCGPL